MTDAISNYTRMALNDPRSRDGLKKLDQAGERATAGAGASASVTVQGDELQLSDVALQAMKTDSFDRAKVDAIKTAIQNGQYPLDARRIAESFYSIEQMIKG
jgi:negative regulator of flagellin synthesis FlgM